MQIMISEFVSTYGHGQPRALRLYIAGYSLNFILCFDPHLSILFLFVSVPISQILCDGIQILIFED